MGLLKDIYNIFNAKNRLEKQSNYSEGERYVRYDIVPLEQANYRRYTEAELQTALNSAENNGEYKLYFDICKEALLDPQMRSIFQTIFTSINSRKILVFLKKSEKIDEEKTEAFNRFWKFQLVESFVKTMLLGFGCIEMGNWIEEDKKFTFFHDVSRYVIDPCTEMLKRGVGDSAYIVNLKDKENLNFCYFFKSKLGDIDVALKPFMARTTADFALRSYTSRISGNSMIYTYDPQITDEKEKQQKVNNLKTLSSSGFAMIPQGETMEVISSDPAVADANIRTKDHYAKEMALAILGSPLSSSEGSTYKEVEAHRDKAYMFLSSYMNIFEMFLNDQFKKSASFCGFELTNYNLKLDNIKPTTSEILDILKVVLPHYDVSEEEIQQLFNLEVEPKQISRTFNNFSQNEL